MEAFSYFLNCSRRCSFIYFYIVFPLFKQAVVIHLFFFLIFIQFHIIFPLFEQTVFIHLFSFSFLFSFSLSFIHIGCLYSSLFFSFFIYFHIVLPLFKQSVCIRLSLLSFLFYSLDSLATRPSGPGCSAVISRTSAGRRRRPRMRQTTSRDAPAGGREAWSLLLMK